MTIVPGMRLTASDGHKGQFYWRVITAKPTELIAVEEETGIPFRWQQHDDGWRVCALRTAIASASPAHGLVDSAWVPVPVTLHPYLGNFAYPDLDDRATAGIAMMNEPGGTMSYRRFQGIRQAPEPQREPDPPCAECGHPCGAHDEGPCAVNHHETATGPECECQRYVETYEEREERSWPGHAVAQEDPCWREWMPPGAIRRLTYEHAVGVTLVFYTWETSETTGESGGLQEELFDVRRVWGLYGHADDESPVYYDTEAEGLQALWADGPRWYDARLPWEPQR